jgi:hypothetical protein
MKQNPQTSLKNAKAAWDLAEIGFDIVGDFASGNFIGLLLFVVAIVTLFWINDGRSTLQDW